MRTPSVIAAAALAAALLTLGACSDDSTGGSPGESDTSSASASTPSASPSASPSDEPTKPTKPTPSGTTINISIKGDTVNPNGSRVKVTRGKPVTLRIDADSPGELHVHSTPEQELEFDEGVSTKRLTIDQPGIVDVEDHELEQVIVQLEVR